MNSDPERNLTSDPGTQSALPEVPIEQLTAFYGDSRTLANPDYEEILIRHKELGQCVAKLDHSGLSFDATNYDFHGLEAEIWLEVTGKIATHAIGRDEDGDTEWNIVDVDTTKILRFDVAIRVGELARLIAEKLQQVFCNFMNGHSESVAVRETNNSLIYDYDHSR